MRSKPFYKIVRLNTDEKALPVDTPFLSLAYLPRIFLEFYAAHRRLSIPQR